MIKKKYQNKNGVVSKYVDEYSTLFTLIDKLENNIIIKHIEGHKKKINKTKIDISFSKVDKKTRQQMRNCIKQINAEIK